MSLPSEKTDTATTDEAGSYSVESMNHLGLVAAMVDELGLVECIDQMMPQDFNQRTVSIGLAVKAMILMGLGYVQRTLYLTPQFFRGKALDRLLGPGILAEHLNDDILGRALDAIYTYGPTEWFGLIAAQAVKRLGLSTPIGHLDSTSLHTDGAYADSEADDDEPVIRVTHGYSRDHRPDLKQIVTQFICENQAGIPVFMKSLSGNSNDQTDFRATIKTHIEGLKEGVGLKYLVADSALYTAETLQQLGGFGWISRVPETLTLAREMTLAVASDLACNPEPLSYRAVCVTHAGIRQRWLIVHTHAARQRAKKTLRKQHLTLSEAESKAFKHLQGKTFACEADATAALQAFCQTLKLTEVHEPQIIASPRRKRGRPGKNQTPATYDYLIQGTLSCPIERYQHKLLRKSCFIVATNELDQAALPDERLLECYKKDQQKVERGFRFLKDPVFLSSTLFLKTPRRIMALMAIMTLCLLVYAAVQWRVRQALQQSQQTYPDQKGKPNPRPTARWVFQSFIDISVLHVSSLKTFVLGLTPAQKALLTLLGDRYVALYANSG